MLPRQPKRWIIKEQISALVDQELSSYPAIFRQILYSHGVQSARQAYHYLSAQVEQDDPFLLTDMRETVDRLTWAIKNHEPIVVYGDYDVDGISATTLMVEVLGRYGAEVQFYIPNRIDEGYGLNVEALEALAAQGAKVVLTVDCGIRSPLEAKRAEELNIDLMISDHHHPDSELPDAFTVVCPKRLDDSYPDKDLSGVGLAYKIAQALAARWPEAGVDPREWLDLVALGTVADVVPLRGENRGLVRQGLAVMRQGRRPGLLSLANVARINLLKVASGEIGFMLGPRLNASGRLESALASLELLMARDIRQAAPLAQQLDDHNRRRQELTASDARRGVSSCGRIWGGKYSFCLSS